MGICKNQFNFVKNYALDKIEKKERKIKMLELGDQILNNHNNFFEGIKTSKNYYQNKLNIDHTSFDLNGLNGAIKLDLSKLNNKYDNKFDIITNHGTTEHINNIKRQYITFKNLHNWAKKDCIFIHCVPLEINEHISYLNYPFPPHGNYEYSSNFWKELSRLNNYEIIKISGNLVSNLALKFPKNFYSAASYKKINDNQFITFEEFSKIFKKYCLDSNHKLTSIGHRNWKNSLPIEIRNKYKL